MKVSNRPISQYQKNNQKQIVFLVLSILVVVTIIYNILFWFYLDQSQHQDIQTTNNSVQTILKNLETKFEALSLDSQFNQMVQQSIQGELSANEFLFYYNNLELIKDNKVNYVLYNENRSVISTNSDPFISESLVLLLMIENEPTSFKVLPINNHESYIVYQIPIVSEFESVGYMMLLISNQVIESLIPLQPSQFAITNQSNSTFVASDTNFLDGYLRKLDLSSVNENLVYRQAYNNNLNIISFSTREFEPFLYVFSSLMIISTALLILLVFLWVSRRLVSINSESVNQLSSQMQQLQAQEIQQLFINTDDEIRDISYQINDLVSSLNQSHQENLALTDFAHESEIKQLIAQFNPHFLYNTLENIRATISFDPALSNRLIQLLVRVLRYSLEEQKEVSIAQDLNVLKDYFEILKIRFNEKFQYQILNQASNQSVTIPKLLIQPLVENSVKYGFMHQKRLNITLSITNQQEDIQLVLVDDGPGIDESKIKEIIQPSHHGVYNSMRRLQLLYPQSEFKIENNQPKGTKITILIRRRSL